MKSLKSAPVVMLAILTGLFLYIHSAEADCPCLSRVVPVETDLYAVAAEGWDEWLDYEMSKGYPIGYVSPDSIKKIDGSPVFIVDYPKRILRRPVDGAGIAPEYFKGAHTLKKDITARTAGGINYRIPKGTRIAYTLPEIEYGYEAKIPKNTRIEPVAGDMPDNYMISQASSAIVKTPLNHQVTIHVDAQKVLHGIPGANDMGTILVLAQHRAPPGGYIDLTLKKNGADFNNARFCVCLKNAGTAGPFVPFEDIQKREVQTESVALSARVPDIRASGLVFSAPAELLVVATRPDGELIAEAMTSEFTVSSRLWAVVFSLLALSVPWWVAGRVVSRRQGKSKGTYDPIRFVAGKYGRASLSLAQILLWTMLVFSASFYVLVVSGKLLNLTTEVLMLLGVVGGSSLIAKIAASAKDEEGRQIVDSVPVAPKWQDLIFSEGKPDLYKFQMALFTALAAVFVVGKIFRTLEFPELPAGLLTLIGLSNGVYLGAKATSKTPYERLSEAYNSLQAARAELQSLEEQEKGAGELQKEAETRKDSVEKELQQINAKIGSKGPSEDLTRLLQQKESTLELAKKKLAEATEKTLAIKKSKTETQGKVTDLEKDFNKRKEEALNQG
jgi:hypothetical protein